MMLAVVVSCCYFPKLGVLVGLLMLALCFAVVGILVLDFVLATVNSVVLFHCLILCFVNVCCLVLVWLWCSV